MNEQSRGLAKPAKWMSRLSGLFALLGVAGYLYVFTNPTLAMRVVSENAATLMPSEINTLQYLLLFVVGAVPLVLFIVALWSARQFFNCYVSGELFPARASANLTRIGKLFLALAILGPVIRTLAVLVITWTNPPGQKQLVLSFSTSDGLLIILSGLLLMVGHILAEANRLSEDNRQII
jgi:hypothetical protein